MPQVGAPRIKVSAIRDAVADALRRALFDGRFQPGDDLSEVAIAAEFEVSRGPVREALFTLAEEGLLTHAHNRGFSVLNFTSADVGQIEAVRLPLESLALTAARGRATDRDLKRLTAARNALVRAFDRGDWPACVHAEVEFHGAIWELSGNPWLVAALRRVLIPSFTYGAAFRLTNPGLTGDHLGRLHDMYVEFVRGAGGRTADECVRLHTGTPGATP